MTKTEALKAAYYALNLIEVTTPRQKKNGTVQFADQFFVNVFYTFHPKSGYYRRKFVSYREDLCGYTITNSEHYQLNKTKVTYHYGGSSTTKRLKVYSLEIQLLNALPAILKYRKYKEELYNRQRGK